MKKELNKHDWSGSNCPPLGCRYHSIFSVGIFKWVQAKKGLKKSAVLYRVKGKSNLPGAVYNRATEICALMDAGEWTSTKKSEFVK